MPAVRRATIGIATTINLDEVQLSRAVERSERNGDRGAAAMLLADLPQERPRRGEPRVVGSLDAWAVEGVTGEHDIAAG